MKNHLKFASILAIATGFAGCANQNDAINAAELQQLRASVEQARDAAMQANYTSQQALALSQQNAEKIDRVFRKNVRK